MLGNIFERLERLPVGFLATSVGLATLSTSYSLLGFSYLRIICVSIAILAFLLGTYKLAFHSPTFIVEYEDTVLASLYGSYSMLAMISGSFISTFFYPLGKGLWLFGIFFHIIIILVFSYKHIFKNFNGDAFVPSWFVTFNGIMVSIVTGSQMGSHSLQYGILVYGIIIFFFIFPFMLRRLYRAPLPDNYYHTKAILLAPSSLCLVSYLTLMKEPQNEIITIFYMIIFFTLLSIIKSIPKFFSFTFHPGFAGTTFPMAIGTLASFKTAIYLMSINQFVLGKIILNIAGLQLFITTTIISIVFFNFLKKTFRV